MVRRMLESGGFRIVKEMGVNIAPNSLSRIVDTEGRCFSGPLKLFSRKILISCVKK